MSFEPREYLRHILAEADYLIGRSAGLTLESFEHDDTLRRAFARSPVRRDVATAPIAVGPKIDEPRNGSEWRIMLRIHPGRDDCARRGPVAGGEDQLPALSCPTGCGTSLGANLPSANALGEPR